MRPATPWALALCFSIVLSGRARAQTTEDCLPPPTPGPVEVTPASGAGGVTRDARIALRYTPGFLADYGGDPSSLLSVWNDDTLENLTGSTEIVGDTLFFLPDALLEPNAYYVGRATGGIADFEFDFRTGATLDMLDPVAGNIQSVSSQPVDPSCSYPDGGFRVDVTMRRAVEDGPAGSLEYLLYQTRGPGLREPVLRTRRRGLATADLFTMAFVLPRAEATEPICVVVQVVDGVGKRDDSQPARCFDPIEGNFFESACSVGAAGSGRGRAPWMIVGPLVWLFVRRRCSHR